MELIYYFSPQLDFPSLLHHYPHKILKKRLRIIPYFEERLLKRF